MKGTHILFLLILHKKPPYIPFSVVKGTSVVFVVMVVIFVVVISTVTVVVVVSTVIVTVVNISIAVDAVVLSIFTVVVLDTLPLFFKMIIVGTTFAIITNTTVEIPKIIHRFLFLYTVTVLNIQIRSVHFKETLRDLYAVVNEDSGCSVVSVAML